MQCASSQKRVAVRPRTRHPTQRGLENCASRSNCAVTCRYKVRPQSSINPSTLFLHALVALSIVGNPIGCPRATSACFYPLSAFGRVWPIAHPCNTSRYVCSPLTRSDGFVSRTSQTMLLFAWSNMSAPARCDSVLWR
jgi:hypothetical protein